MDGSDLKGEENGAVKLEANLYQYGGGEVEFKLRKKVIKHSQYDIYEVFVLYGKYYCITSMLQTVRRLVKFYRGLILSALLRRDSEYDA